MSPLAEPNLYDVTSDKEILRMCSHQPLKYSIQMALSLGEDPVAQKMRQ